MSEIERDSITLTKAFGIILMVFAHSLIEETPMWSAIFAFHMPLFFIMSGYCFKEKYLSDAKTFFIRKIKGIYLPFVLFSIPYVLMHNVFCQWNIYDPEAIYGIKKIALDIVRIVTRMSHDESLLGTFCFLKHMFYGYIIYYVLLRVLKGRIMPTTLILLVLSELATLVHFRIPYFNVSYISFFSAFFIAFGYWWKKSEWPLQIWWVWPAGIALIAGELLLVHAACMTSLPADRLPLYVLPAIGGTMMVYELSRMLVTYVQGYKWPLLKFIGNHTLAIMALHFTAFKLVSLFYIKINDWPISRLSEFPIIHDCVHTLDGVALYTLVGLFVPLVLAWGWMKAKQKLRVKS